MRRQARGYGWAILTTLLLTLAGCGPRPTPSPTATATPTITPTATQTATATISPSGPAQRLHPQILATYPHDTNAFTEGLVFDAGHFYESTGQYGQSTLREVDPQTGEVLSSISLAKTYFGEGLALVGDQLVQLTWRENTAFVYDKATFTQQRQMTFEGEGWGLCYDGQQLYMSDGSSTIAIRSPDTLEKIGSLDVVLDGQPIDMINELECVGGDIYANVWHTDHILRIDKATGRVTGLIDASGLLTPAERSAAGTEGVLNGIAYDAQQDVFFITGKRWPKLFEVRFVAAGS